MKNDFKYQINLPHDVKRILSQKEINQLNSAFENYCKFQEKDHKKRQDTTWLTKADAQSNGLKKE